MSRRVIEGPGLWGEVWGVVDQMLYKSTRPGVQRAMGWRFTTGDRRGFEQIADSVLQALQLHYKWPVLECLAGFFVAHIQALADVVERHLAATDARIALLEDKVHRSENRGRPSNEETKARKALEAIVARWQKTRGDCVPTMDTPLAYMRYGEMKAGEEPVGEEKDEAPAAAATG